MVVFLVVEFRVVVLVLRLLAVVVDFDSGMDAALGGLFDGPGGYAYNSTYDVECQDAVRSNRGRTVGSGLLAETRTVSLERAEAT